MLLWKCTLLQVNVMLKELPEEEFGPGIDIREYSILDNPYLPSEVNTINVNSIYILNHELSFLYLLSGNLCLGSVQVKKSWLNVQLCKEGNQDCDASNNTTAGGVLKFPKHSNEETVFEILIHLMVTSVQVLLGMIIFVCPIFLVLPRQFIKLH